jgi:hypothetical protein
MKLEELANTRWRGTGELWLDPLGDEAHRYDCTLAVGTDAIEYTWSHEGQPHQGRIELRDGSARWSDGWHQPQQVDCRAVPGAWGLLALHYSYSAPGSPDWGWRITLSQRPTGELVLQMTNIAPWGEEARAVRMLLTREP